MIEVCGLVKSFGARPAVNGLSFSVAAGEVVGLIGLNGAGKTTTLQCIAGLLQPDDGEVRICGADTVRASSVAKQHLAYLADEPEFFSYLTLQEHVELAARIYGSSRGDHRNALHPYGLADDASRFPDELSRGQRQKLAMACALWRCPDAVVLDEPLTGLDPLGILEMKDLIAAQARRGAAVLLSSHLLDMVSEVCSRAVVVADGAVVRTVDLKAMDLGSREALSLLFSSLVASGVPE